MQQILYLEYWKSVNLLHGIQCEHHLYNEAEEIIKTFQSDINNASTENNAWEAIQQDLYYDVW